MLRKHRQRRNPAKAIPTTRVSVIVINSEKQMLLVKHRKGTRQYWVVPGGRLEYGETFHECGVREVKEETGLDVEIERIVFMSEAIAPDRSRHIVNVFMLGRVVGGSLKLGNEAVLAAVEFRPLNELKNATLYPPVATEIIESVESDFDGGIKYLGNLWV